MTTRRNISYLIALTASGLLLAASAGPASAELLRTPDPAGDMVVTDDMTGTTSAAPNATVGDIKRASVRYRVRALSLRVRFEDLRRTGQGLAIKGGIRVKGGAVWPFVAGGEPGHWKGTASLSNPNFRKVSCHLRFHINYDDNVMMLRIPSRCLKKPRWVRLSFGSIHRDNHDKIYEDEAFSGSWSPRVRRAPRSR
jgi:hypothetical protein